MLTPLLPRQVADAGSLNGTLLNGTRISVPGRRRGAAYRLNSDDLLQLGTSTAIKVLPSLSIRLHACPLRRPCGCQSGQLSVGTLPVRGREPEARKGEGSALSKLRTE